MQPNILFAFADDWGRYASAYQRIEGPNSLNQLIDTPNFDRIAREGALFTNAFVPAPSCTPCRSSILSGQYFWQTGLGAILSGAIWDESIPTYPLELEKAGYHIGYTYKVWSPGKAANAPYGAERTRYESAGTNYRGFSHWATRHADELGVEGAKRALLNETRDNFNAFLDARPQRTHPSATGGAPPTPTAPGNAARAKPYGIWNPTTSKAAYPASCPMYTTSAKTSPTTWANVRLSMLASAY